MPKKTSRRRAAVQRAAIGAAGTAAAILALRAAFALPRREAWASRALPPPDRGPLAGALAARAAAHPGLTGILRLNDGAPAFAARMLLADAAVRSIDAQYYIWTRDLTGLLLLDAMRRAADRGVRVRLLLDDNGIDGLDPHLATLSAHPSVEVRLWNPFNLRHPKRAAYLFDFPRLNRRMHNKSFTVDGRATVVGGRNIGDEYFGTGPRALYFDRDVLAVGTAVEEVSDEFDAYWRAPSAHSAGPILGAPPGGDPIRRDLGDVLRGDQWRAYEAELRGSPLVRDLAAGEMTLDWVRARTLADDPAKGEGRAAREALLAHRLHEAVGGVRERLDAVSPYFVPGRAGCEAFAGMARRGVAVRILTNALEATDVLPVHAGYARYRPDLLRAGVRLFELRRDPGAARMQGRHPLERIGASAASLHAKTFAVDGRRAYVGSFNFDPRSTVLNTEMGLLIDSPEMATDIHGAFDGDLRGLGYEVFLHRGRLHWRDLASGVVADVEPGRALLKGAAVTALRALPVEWLL